MIVPKRHMDSLLKRKESIPLFNKQITNKQTKKNLYIINKP